MINLIVFVLVNFTPDQHQDALSFEQVALNYFIDSIYTKANAPGGKMICNSFVDDEYSRFRSWCFDDYRVIAGDTALFKKTRKQLPVQSNGCELNIAKTKATKHFYKGKIPDVISLKDKNKYLSVHRVNALKPDHFFVEVAVLGRYSFVYYYIEMDASKNVLRWCENHEVI